MTFWILFNNGGVKRGDCSLRCIESAVAAGEMSPAWLSLQGSDGFSPLRIWQASCRSNVFAPLTPFSIMRPGASPAWSSLSGSG